MEHKCLANKLFHVDKIEHCEGVDSKRQAIYPDGVSGPTVLVQTFSDGHTLVFCRALREGKCNLEWKYHNPRQRPKCIYLAQKV